MRPKPRSAIPGATRWVTRKLPRTLTSKISETGHPDAKAVGPSERLLPPRRHSPPGQQEARRRVERTAASVEDFDEPAVPEPATVEA